MKIKKFSAFAVLAVMLFACAAYSAQPEDALSVRNEESVYMTLRLNDTASFLKWVFSDEHLKLFVLAAKQNASEEEALAVAEFLRTMVGMSPLRESALTIGMNKPEPKSLNMPFLQFAFTAGPEVSEITAKIADGTAEAGDLAALIMGNKIAAAFIETMIKVERGEDNILRINNDIFMTAKDDVVLVASSLEELRASLNALDDEKARMFTAKPRKFAEKDFMLMHIDYATAAELDDDELDEINAEKYFAKPLEVEFAFNRTAEKFLMSLAVNLVEALKKEYAEQLYNAAKNYTLVKGGHIDLASIGGKTSPLAAIGTYVNFALLKDQEEAKPFVSAILRNLRVRFGISEEEAYAILTGPFSAVVNGTVTFEGFKIPALYMSLTGQKGAAAKVFGKLTKSPHFSKVHDGILQLDSSISPVSCLAADRGESLGVCFAELASFSEKPELAPAFAQLMNRESIASIWVDFAGIQRWINDDENGVFMTVGPLMTFAGYGKYFKAIRDVFNAELSVPSMSIWTEKIETVHMEFALKDINPENGLVSKILKAYNELNTKSTSEDKKTPNE